MELKSKMSLDISGVTSNLKKVASQTATLGKEMSTAFNGTSDSFKTVNTLALEARAAGVSTSKVLVAQANILSRYLKEPFMEMATYANAAFNKTQAGMKEFASALKYELDVFGVKDTLTSRVNAAVGAFKAGMSQVKTVGRDTAATLKQSLASSFESFETTSFSGKIEAAKVMVGMLADSIRTKITSSVTSASLSVARLKEAFVTMTGTSKSRLQKLTSSAIVPLIDKVDKLKAKFDKLGDTLSGKLYRGTEEAKKLDTTIKKTSMSFKDFGRIVEGIVVAKLFYSMLNSIRNVIAGVWEFNSALEYSKMVYTNFFGDTSLATGFIEVLKDFAAQTRFSFAELNTAAQQLVAYGFQAKNLMYILQGVSAAASVSGDPARMEQISRALGQIYNKGRLMGEEMRQLTEANIPAYDILQRKLGLTYKQMQNLADESIPASVAINALVEGINEEFGGLLEYSSMSLLGMISNIGDVGSQLANGMFKPMLQFGRFVTKTLLIDLEGLLDAFNKSGTGGVFEHLIPPELQDTVRSIIGGLGQLIHVIQILAQSAYELARALGPTLLTWINALISGVAMVGNIIGALVGTIMNNTVAFNFLAKALTLAAAAFVVFRVRALAAFIAAGLISVVTGISKALGILSGALTALVQHPALLMLLTITGLFLVLTGTVDKARNALNKFLASFNSASAILQPTETEGATGAIDDYNNALDQTKDATDDVTDATKKAAKAAKGLLSFDEVFTNPKPTSSSGDDKDTSAGEVNTGDIAAGIGDIGGMFDDVDFTNFGGKFVDKLVDGIVADFATLKDKLIEGFTTIDFNTAIIAALAAVLAIAILGFNPVGLFVAFAAALVIIFWDDIMNAFGLTPTINLGTVILAAITTAIAFMLMGFTAPALFASVAAALVIIFWDDIAAAFGIEEPKISLQEVVIGAIGIAAVTASKGLTGKNVWAVITLALVATFWDEIIEKFGLTWDIDLGSVISVAIIGAGAAASKGLKAGLWTALIAALVLGFQDDLEAKFGEEVVHQAIGTTVATSLVSALTKTKGNSTLQAAIAGIGLMLVAEMIKGIGEAFGKDEEETSASISLSIVGAILGGIAAATIGLPVTATVLITAFATGLVKLFEDEIDKAFNSPAFQGTMVASLGLALALIIGGIPGAVVAAIALACYAIWYFFGDELKKSFGEIVPNIKEDLKAIWAPVLEYFNFDDKDLGEIGANIVNGIVSGIGAVVQTIGQTVYDVLVRPFVDAVKDKFGIHSPATTMMPIGDFLIQGIFGGISDAIPALIEGIGTFVDDIGTAFSDWFGPVKDGLTLWCSDTTTAVTEWGTNAAKSFQTWVDDTGKDVGDWVTARGTDFKDFKDDAEEKVSTWQTNTGKNISDWVTSVGGHFKSFRDDATEKVGKWSSDTGEDITTWTEDTFKDFKDWSKDASKKVAEFGTAVKSDFEGWTAKALGSVTSWTSSITTDLGSFVTSSLTTIGGWASSIGSTVSNALSGAWDSVTEIAGKVVDTVTKKPAAKVPVVKGAAGHATGGVFNREHYAQFAEGNKAEAIIPLENKSAMQPFVDAVADGLYQVLGPALANLSGGSGEQIIMQVGTLIADDRSMKELSRKMRIIEATERDRIGGDN